MTSLRIHLLVGVSVLAATLACKGILDRRELGRVQDRRAALVSDPDCGLPAARPARDRPAASPGVPVPPPTAAPAPLPAASPVPAPAPGAPSAPTAAGGPRAAQPPPVDLDGMAAGLGLRPQEVQQISQILQQRGSALAGAISDARGRAPAADAKTAELDVMLAGIKVTLEAEREYVAVLGPERAVQAERLGFDLGRELAHTQKEALDRAFAPAASDPPAGNVGGPPR